MAPTRRLATATWLVSSLAGTATVLGLWNTKAPLWLWITTITWMATTTIWIALRNEIEKHQ